MLFQVEEEANLIIEEDVEAFNIKIVSIHYLFYILSIYDILNSLNL